jgi:hypothetical protein
VNAEHGHFSRSCFLLLVKYRWIPLKNVIQNLLSQCLSVEYSVRYQPFTVAQNFYLFCGCANFTIN